MKQVIKTGKRITMENRTSSGNIVFRDYSRFLIKTM